jgi:hypothetical protein
MSLSRRSFLSASAAVAGTVAGLDGRRLSSFGQSLDASAGCTGKSNLL